LPIPGDSSSRYRQLAEVVVEDGPAQISHENIHRRMSVEAIVRRRDLGSFVADHPRGLDERITLPNGYYLEFGGQFENLQRASARLTIVLAVALFLIIFVLVNMTFNAVSPSLLFLVNIPIAATDGIFALPARGMPFSISAGVGLSRSSASRS
jgi:cobalt-zinc-cadmium resistance protein CzcA